MKKMQKNITVVCVILIAIFTNVFAQSNHVVAISKDSLPKEVKEAFNKKYSAYKITKANKIKEAGKNDFIYEVEAETLKKNLQLVYNEQGQLLKKRSSKILWYDGTEKVKAPTSPSNDGHNHTH